VALLEANKPQEGLLCLSKSSTGCAKACFNLGVAYETGKYDLPINGQPQYLKAFEYYEMAAKMGHKLAIYNLALFYLQGKGGVVVDENKAQSLLIEAAQLGVKQAQDYCRHFDMLPKKGPKNPEVAKSSLGQETFKVRNEKQTNLEKEVKSSLPEISLAKFVESFMKPKAEKEREIEEEDTPSVRGSDFELTPGLHASRVLSLPVAFVQ
jgi:TPR repeat protein